MNINFLKQKKIIISILLSLVAIYFCVIDNFYFEEKYVDNVYYTSSGAISTNVVSGDVLEQEFVLNEGDYGVSLFFATYTTQVTQGTLEVEVFDEQGEKVFTDALPADNIRDNQYYDIMFKNVAENLFGQKCVLRVTFVGVDGQAIGLYASDTDVKMECDYYINGVEQTNDLAMKGLEKTEDTLAWKDIRLIYVLVFVGVLLYFFAFKEKEQQPKVKDSIKNIIICLKNNKKNIAIGVVLFIVAIIIACFAESLLFQEKGYMNPYRWFMLFVINLVVMESLYFRTYIWKYAHIYFFIVAMLMGTTAIVSVPIAHISWDEQIHYGDTAYLSWGANGVVSLADYKVTADIQCGVFEHLFTRGTREDNIAYLNSVSQTDFVEYEDSVGSRMLSYVPASIGLIFARFLGLSFLEQYMFGKIANLFCYSLFLSLAIKNLKQRGKIIVAILGLIPTSIFLAICYAYDWWVISLVILGYSIFIGDIQKNGYISTKKLVLSVGTIVAGLFIKAVYFPIMFPMMLLKKEKYEDSKKARWIVFWGMILLLASFVLPILFAGAGTGDYRGGEGVNSTEQIKFILTNITGYMKILFDFLWYYLSPDNAYHYLTFMAYVSGIPYASLIMILLIMATVIDNSEQIVFRKKNPLVRIGNILGAIGSLVLVVTALYVSFTPVGMNTINGCQFRYILPVLFPFLFFTGEYEIKVSEELKGKYYMFAIIMMMLVFLNGWNNNIISRY